MKIILEKQSKDSRADYREDRCCMCDKCCNPHYRFHFYSKEEDIHGNSIIDGEISSCSECYSKIAQMFK